MEEMKTTIIVPCYNEEKRLPVEEFISFAENNDDVRFVFVNDGSQDNTPEILKALSRRNPLLSVIHLKENRGKAEAVRQGVLHALKHFSPDYIGYWDADLATPLHEIRKFVDDLSFSPCQIIIGSRLIRREIGRAHV